MSEPAQVTITLPDGARKLVPAGMTVADFVRTQIGPGLAKAALFAKFETASAWFTPELLAIPEATDAGWIAQTQELAPYRFTILDNYRRQAHVLDAKGEHLLSLATRFNGVADSRVP